MGMAEKVALLEDISTTAHDVFQGAGYEVVTFPKSIDPDELAGLAAEAVVLGVRSGPKVSAAVLSDNLDAVSVFGAGVNHVTRVAEAGSGERGTDERGITIINAAHENTRSVAELVVGSVFSLLRDMHGHNRQMHQGAWTKTNGQEVRGKTIGILGYGSIGSQVSTLAESIGMNVNYFDPMTPLARGRAKRLQSVEAVLADSDIVTLHMPGGKANYHVIDAEKLEMMRPGSYLINAARGDLVDYDALADALDEGHLAGAAVDVYTDEGVGYTEPSKKGDNFEHTLREHPKVLLLPHIGGSTVEAQRSIGESVALKTVAYLTTGNTMGSVNMPNKALGGIPEGDSRLLHIHDNEPGAMASAFSMIAENGLNVIDSSQGVRDGIGFLAADVEGAIPESVIEAIRAEKAVRRLRVLGQ